MAIPQPKATITRCTQTCQMWVVLILTIDDPVYFNTSIEYLYLCKKHLTNSKVAATGTIVNMITNQDINKLDPQKMSAVRIARKTNYHSHAGACGQARVVYLDRRLRTHSPNYSSQSNCNRVYPRSVEVNLSSYIAN